MCYIDTTEYYSAIKKELNLAICDAMDGPWGYYAKWNKLKTNTIWFHLYVESEKENKGTKFIDTGNRLMVARGDGGWGWEKWVKGIKGYKF